MVLLGLDCKRTTMAGEHIKLMLEENPGLYVYKTNVLHLVDKDEYFLHIPKCGGTSVRDALIYKYYKTQTPQLDYLNFHNHSKAQDLVSAIDIENCNFIVSVRHPIGRFLSAYNFLIDIDVRNIERNDENVEFYKTRKGYLDKIRFSGFADLLADETERKLVKKTYFNTPDLTHFDWAFQLQTSWVKGVPKSNVTYYKIEDNSIFNSLDVSIHRSKMKQYNRNIGIENKDKIYKYFEKDFDRFKYQFSEQWDEHHLLNERMNSKNLPDKVLKGLLGGTKVLKP